MASPQLNVGIASNERRMFEIVLPNIGKIVCGGADLAFVAGPCSVESESQIMEAAKLVKEAGCDGLRGGVVKYRSSP